MLLGLSTPGYAGLCVLGWAGSTGDGMGIRHYILIAVAWIRLEVKC